MSEIGNLNNIAAPSPFWRTRKGVLEPDMSDVICEAIEKMEKEGKPLFLTDPKPNLIELLKEGVTTCPY